MLVIGLTGGVAMGKSTVAQMFADEGTAIFDADAAVHALYKGAAAGAIEAAFPGTARDGVVDRVRLSDVVTRDPVALARLEAIVHPLVATAQSQFLAAAAKAAKRIAVLDIPLLFETGGDAAVDAVVVVSTTAAVQRERVRARGRMSQAQLEALIARQMSDSEKRRRAHFVIDTGGPLEATRLQVRGILRALSATAAG
jgi:dephospho-CoA kinase